MARYIDADALLGNLKRQYGEELGWWCTVNMSDVGMMIEDAPTANVAPMEEVERLNKEVDRLSQVVLYHEGITQMEVDEAIADTVKKMQDELKKTFSALCKGEMDDLYRIIDLIAKEILEGNHEVQE